MTDENLNVRCTLLSSTVTSLPIKFLAYVCTAYCAPPLFEYYKFSNSLNPSPILDHILLSCDMQSLLVQRGMSCKI